MSDLFSLLGLAARALEAQRYGLDVTGQNISNVNTPGYTRRSVVLAEVPPYDRLSAGGGVNIEAVVAARTPFIDARLFQEQPALGRHGAILDGLAVVQTALGPPGASLDAALASFYNSFGALTQDATSTTARQQVIYTGQALAKTFNELAERFAVAQRDADAEVRTSVDQVNGLASRVAALNGAIAAADANEVDALHDQQSVALKSLAGLIDIGVMTRQDGGVDVSIGNGRALVVGNNTYPLTTTTSPPLGFASVVATGADVPADITSEITGGRLGGLIQLRDVLLPGYADRLDRLAYGVASDVNALHRSGFDLNGAQGTDFFVPLASQAGAARSMAVDASIAADPSLVVAAAVPTAGNNDIARAIAALQDAPMTGTSTKPVDAWSELVYRVGADASSAAQEQRSHHQVIEQLEALRNQISGVSLDEEAAMLMKFQRAYEANARFFGVANQALDVLMQMVRSS